MQIIKPNLDSTQHESLDLLECRMSQVHEMIGTLDLSNSNIGIAKFSVRMDISHNYINSIPYRIANVGAYSTKDIEDSLETVSNKQS